MKKTKQDKSKINNEFKINPYFYHKISMEMDFFTAHPETETKKAASAKSTQVKYNGYSDSFKRTKGKGHIFIAN